MMGVQLLWQKLFLVVLLHKNNSSMKSGRKSEPKSELGNMNAIQVRDKVNSSSIAVLVIGACENHGDHMPFGADFIFPTELVKRVAARLKNVIILPHIPYGVSLHHNEFQMTMSLEPNTLKMLIEEICTSVIRNGIGKVLIINGHDGNIAPIEVAARSIKNKHPEVVIACLEAWWILIGQIAHGLFDVWDGLGHGGEAETSAMLAVRPDLVCMVDAPPEVIPKLPSNVRIYWKFNELTDTGATGAPRKATVQKGHEILKVLEQILLSFVEEMEDKDWKYGLSRE
jgi:creatinine amidohydrolase